MKAESVSRAYACRSFLRIHISAYSFKKPEEHTLKGDSLASIASKFFNPSILTFAKILNLVGFMQGS